MYLAFFGMRELPFTLIPNTDFFLELDGQHQALQLIHHALESGEAFIKITGEVGTGKTLLCRRLLDTLDDSFVTAYIPNPFLTPDGLMLALADELDLDVQRERGRHHILNQINDKLIEIRESGRQVIFLLDEAQALPEDSLEALGLLTKLETESKKRLQVVLFGQAELNDLLARDSLRQLQERVTFSYTLPVLSEDDVPRYINHRLSRAGFPGVNLFSPQAIQLLGKSSQGIPRRINILAHKALLLAFARGDTQVSHLHVRRALEDSEDKRIDRHLARIRGKPIWIYLLLTAVLSCALTLLLVYLFTSMP
ncbi:MAG: AAA family ATPase [Pseudomonadales bacterium]|nr:AAA family ATPase [Pseudomonadales bacterium]